MTDLNKPERTTDLAKTVLDGLRKEHSFREKSAMYSELSTRPLGSTGRYSRHVESYLYKLIEKARSAYGIQNKVTEPEQAGLLVDFVFDAVKDDYLAFCHENSRISYYKDDIAANAIAAALSIPAIRTLMLTAKTAQDWSKEFTGWDDMANRTSWETAYHIAFSDQYLRELSIAKLDALALRIATSAIQSSKEGVRYDFPGWDALKGLLEDIPDLAREDGPLHELISKHFSLFWNMPFDDGMDLLADHFPSILKSGYVHLSMQAQVPSAKRFKWLEQIDLGPRKQNVLQTLATRIMDFEPSDLSRISKEYDIHFDLLLVNHAWSQENPGLLAGADQEQVLLAVHKLAQRLEEYEEAISFLEQYLRNYANNKENTHGR